LATTFFLRNAAADFSSTAGDKAASLARGAASVTKVTNTVNGPTAGVVITDTAGGTALQFFTPCLKAVTIAGTVTFNIRGLESAIAANAGYEVKIERCNSAGVVQSTIIDSERGTEIATADGANNWTGTPTSTALSDGDRLKITVLINDAGGNQASARTVTTSIDGPTSGAAGDSFVTFTETITPGIFPTAIASAESVGRPSLARPQTVQTSSIADYDDIVLGDNPVAFWTRNAAGVYADRQGGNSATVVGTVTVNSPGLVNADDDDGGALLDGTTGYLNVATEAALNLGNGPLSLEIWLQYTAAPTTVERKLFDRSTNGSYQLICSAITPGVVIEFKKAGGTQICRSTQHLEDTGIYHVVATWDGTTCHIYINGVDVSGNTLSQTLVDTAGDLHIGASRTGTADFFPGVLQKPAMYATVLTPADVKNHYDAGITSHGGIVSSAVTLKQPARSILPSAIASAESVGTPTLIPVATILPTAIVSAESIGSHTLRAVASILPTAIDTGEVVGTLTLQPGSVTIAPSAIASAQSLGSPTLVPIASILPASINSAESVGSHTLRPGGVTIAPNAITSAESLGTPALVPVASILPSSIGSAESLGSPTLLPGSVAILPTAINSGEATGSPSLVKVIAPSSINEPSGSGSGVFQSDVFQNDIFQTGGASSAVGTPTLKATATILPGAIASAESVGTPELVSTIQKIIPTAIASGEAVGTPTLVPVAMIAPSAIGSAESVGTPTLLPGAVTILPSAIGSVEQVGTPTLVPVATILPSSIGSAESVGAPSLIPGSVTILPTSIGSAEGLGTPSLLAGGVLIQPTAIGSAQAVGTPTLVAIATILPTAIGSAESVGTPTLLHGGVLIIVNGIATGQALGDPTLVRPAVAGTIQPTAIPSDQALGTPTLLPGGVTIQPTAIGSGESVGSPTLRSVATILPSAIDTAESLGTPTLRAVAAVIPTAIASGESVGTPALLPGNVVIQPNGITSGEALGSPTVIRLLQIVSPTGVGTGEALGTPTIIPGNANVTPGGITSAELFGLPVLVPTSKIVVEGIAGAEALGFPVLQPGNLFILPDGVASGEALGNPALLLRLIRWKWVNREGWAGTTDTGNGNQTGWAGTTEIGGEPVQSGFGRTRTDEGDS
jgi:hypothetical protein